MLKGYPDDVLLFSPKELQEAISRTKDECALKVYNLSKFFTGRDEKLISECAEAIRSKETLEETDA